MLVSKFKIISMKLRNIIAVCVLMAFMASCKPTEQGYKAAYDAAKKKREQVDPDNDLLTGGHRLLNENASLWKVIAGDSLQMQHSFIKPDEGFKWPQNGPYHLAVAMFKMQTNARSMLKDLHEKGDSIPIIATDGKGKLYIIAGSASNADSLANVLTTFRRQNPKFPYIGLTPPRPLIIVSR